MNTNAIRTVITLLCVATALSSCSTLKSSKKEPTPIVESNSSDANTIEEAQLTTDQEPESTILEEAQAEAEETTQMQKNNELELERMSRDKAMYEAKLPDTEKKSNMSDVPPLSSNMMSSTTQAPKPTPQKTARQTGTFILIIGSYSSIANAEKAVAQFNSNYPDLRGQANVVVTGDKFRVGFINFKTRDEAIAYKHRLVTNHTEFNDAWPYQP